MFDLKQKDWMNNFDDVTTIQGTDMVTNDISYQSVLHDLSILITYASWFKFSCIYLLMLITRCAIFNRIINMSISTLMFT